MEGATGGNGGEGINGDCVTGVECACMYVLVGCIPVVVVIVVVRYQFFNEFGL